MPPAVADLVLVRSMRQVVLFSALLLTACSTYTRVVGPYRANLSRTDVQSIVQLGQQVRSGYYNFMFMQAVGPDEVWVDCEQGSTSFGFTALRRGGTWKVGKFIPPPPDY